MVLCEAISLQSLIAKEISRDSKEKQGNGKWMEVTMMSFSYYNCCVLFYYCHFYPFQIYFPLPIGCYFQEGACAQKGAVDDYCFNWIICRLGYVNNILLNFGNGTRK